MSVVTYARDLPAYFDERRGQAGGPSLFSRLVTALHHSRELQAARAIERHRHLIDANAVAFSRSFST
jgi:hypothetical protein